MVALTPSHLLVLLDLARRASDAQAAVACRILLEPDATPLARERAALTVELFRTRMRRSL